jgi:hypothetical protein
VEVTVRRRQTRGEKLLVTEDNARQQTEEDDIQKNQQEPSAGYDSYRSLAAPNIIIVVPKNAVPPFRFRAGGWELLEPSIGLNAAAQARVAEEGFFIGTANPVRSGELIASHHNGPAPISLEVEFALVIARMIESLRDRPDDMRQIIYDLARYKLQEQLLHASSVEKDFTRRALEGAIRGVEEFSKKHVLGAEPQSQPNSGIAASADGEASSPKLVPQAEASRRVDSEWGAGVSEYKNNLWPYLRRTAAIIIILVASLMVIQQQRGSQDLAHILPKPEPKTAVDGQSTQSIPTAPPAKSAALQPTDYGVYAISDDRLFDLALLQGRPPDIRIAFSAPLAAPSRTILPNGHLRFIAFGRDLALSADRPEVRIVAKVVREFSDKGAGSKPADETWVIRNISFPFRSSPANDNPEMIELHSEDPAVVLTPGRYALVLKNKAYDFSVEGNIVDPRHCIERIVGPTGIFYSDCKKP